MGANTNCCNFGEISNFSIPLTNIGSGAGGCQIAATGSTTSGGSGVWSVPIVITATADAASGLGGTLMSGTATIAYVESQDHYTLSITVPNTTGTDGPLVLTGTTSSGCGEGTKTGTFTGSGAEDAFPCYNGAVVEPNQIENPWTGTFSFNYSYPEDNSGSSGWSWYYNHNNNNYTGGIF